MFVASTKDEKIRAFDKRSGQVVWQFRLEAGGYAAPATYAVWATIRGDCRRRQRQAHEPRPAMRSWPSRSLGRPCPVVAAHSTGRRISCSIDDDDSFHRRALMTLVVEAAAMTASACNEHTRGGSVLAAALRRRRSVEWKPTRFGGEGEVHRGRWRDPSSSSGNDLTGITWTGDLPRLGYEIEVQAKRVSGSDFFCGLTFPVGEATVPSSSAAGLAP